MSNETLEHLDESLKSIRSEINIYQLVTPTNLNAAREDFETQLTRDASSLDPDELQNPEFEYTDADFTDDREELKQLEADIDQIDVNPIIGGLYQDTIDEVYALIDIAENLGDSKIVREASEKIYGRPSKETIKLADEILSERTDAVDELQRFSSSQMETIMAETLEASGLNEWRVELADRGSVSVNAASQLIQLPRDREFTENEIARLPVHEIGAHAIRGANGYEQDYKILGSGAGGYHATDEGIALLLEKMTGLSDPELMKKYAGRVKAVQSALNGDDFSETCALAKKHGFDDELAWELSYRGAHRAGGFLKDHIYLEGLTKVTDWLENEGELEELMIGKVSTEQAEQLIQLESISKPQYSPVDILYNVEDSEELLKNR